MRTFDEGSGGATDPDRRPDRAAPASAAPGHHDRRRRLGEAALLAGAALVVLGAFLPWVISGSASRSSFASVRSADRLGIVPDGVGVVLLRSWYLVPLCAALVPVLLAARRPRLGAVVALLLAALTSTIAGVVVAFAPDVGAGPVVCLAGGAVLVAGAVLVISAGPADRP